MKADHFAFEVSDINRAVKFYTEALGMKLLFNHFDEVHHEAYAFLELDGCNLELLQGFDEENKPVPFQKSELRQPYTPHLAIVTENIEKKSMMLQDKNVTIVKGIMEIPGEVKWLYASDPDNNVIEFVQWLAK